MKVDPRQAKKVAVARNWIAQRIRFFRLSRGITQRELSNRMEIHFTRVSDLESNTTDFKISTLLRACLGIGVPIEELVKVCPGWETRADFDNVIIMADRSTVRSVLVEAGLSTALAERICATLLSKGR